MYNASMMVIVNVLYIISYVRDVNNYYDRLYHTSCRYHTKLFIYIHLLALTSRDCPHLCVIV